MSSPAAGSPVVLGALAVLAVLFKKPGAEITRTHLQAGVIGAANLAEVLAKLSDHGLPAPEAARAVAILGLEVTPMTEAQAQRSAGMRAATRVAGLSLGDRACLALAVELGAPAVTADRGWAGIAEATGVKVEVVR